MAKIVSQGNVSKARRIFVATLLLCGVLLASGGTAFAQESGKVDPRIAHVIHELTVVKDYFGRVRALAKDTDPFHPRVTEKGEIWIAVVLNPGGDGAIKKLEEAGLRVENISSDAKLAQGFAYFAKIKAITALPFVTSVNLPSP